MGNATLVQVAGVYTPSVPADGCPMKAYSLLASLSPVRPFPTKEDAPQLLLPRMAADELPPHREQPWIIDKRGYRKVDPAMTLVPLSRL